MRKFIKENWKILLSFLIIIILFPTFILVPSPIGFIPKDIGLQIIGYGGSIFGGFLTLYGVWWTIKKQDETKKEDRAIELKPILQASCSEMCDSETILQQSGNITIHFVVGYNINESDIPTIGWDTLFPHYLNLKNVGRGEMYNLELIDYKITNASQPKLDYTLVLDNQNYPIFLLKNHIFTISISNYTVKKSLEYINALYLENLYVTFILKFRFSDTFNNYYTQDIEMMVWLNDESLLSNQYFEIDNIFFTTQPPIAIE